jgi:hypothetical protein
LTIEEDELERALFLVGGTSSKSQFDQERVEELLLALDRIERRESKLIAPEATENVAADAAAEETSQPLISTNPNAIVASTTSTSSDSKEMSSESSTSTGKDQGQTFTSKVKNSIKVNRIFMIKNSDF